MLGDQVTERCGEVAAEAVRLFRDRVAERLDRLGNLMLRQGRVVEELAVREAIAVVREVN